jgi:hypothetical protein
MEPGYNTIDLIMLAIAAFVIWMVMRVPKDKKAFKEELMRSKSRQGQPVSS